MNQITPKPPMGQKRGKERFTAAESKYNAWLHLNCTCIVTGQPEFDIAHTGDLRHGKGMRLKAWYETSLPLIRPLHMHEERNRANFWHTVGLPDYIELAKGLWNIYQDGSDPTVFLELCQRRVDRDYVATLLGEIDF